MLEVGAVVCPWRQQRDDGVRDADRGDAAQVLEQHVRIVLDGRDGMAREQLREEPHHHLAVLEHVGHAGRNAQVVLEHVELAIARAHDVDASDVRVDPARHVDVLHLRAILCVAQDQLRRDHAGAEDLLAVVDVAEECIERAHSLAQAGLEPLPVLGRQDARHDVERDQSFRALVLAVDGERDADAMEEGVGFGTATRQPVGRLRAQPRAVLAIVPTGRPVGREHFVVGNGAHGILTSRDHSANRASPSGSRGSVT